MEKKQSTTLHRWHMERESMVKKGRIPICHTASFLLYLVFCRDTQSFSVPARLAYSCHEALSATTTSVSAETSSSAPTNTTALCIPYFLSTVDRQPPLSKIQSTLRPQAQITILGPDPATKPDYENIVGPLGQRIDDLLLRLFSEKLAEQVGVPDPKNGFAGIIDLAAGMNARFRDASVIQERATQVLRNMFPSWLPGSYAVLFSRPFPAFSARMNAWATWVGGTWLMGECEVNDVEAGEKQGLLVKRCRFLEESGCASVCVNSCKIPTQNFFKNDMGLALTMDPDYETFECQFSFGQLPTDATENTAQQTPCLSRCPTAGSYRSKHQSESRCNLMDGMPVE